MGVEVESAVHGSGPSGRFSLGPTIARSRELISGTKRYAFGLLVLFAVLDSALATLLGPGPGEAGSFGFQIAMSFSASVVLLVHATFGLTVVAGKRLTFGRLFRYMGRLPAILVVILPLNLAYTYLELQLEAWLLLLPSLLLIPLAFWPLYVVDRGMGPLAAVGGSYDLVLRNLGDVLLYLLLNAALFVVIALTVGIAAIWLLPFFAIAPAVMFASAEGLEGTYDA